MGYLSPPSLVVCFRYGGQDANHKTGTLYAWAVLPGDALAVPLPAAFSLFGSGVLGLVGFARRKQTA